MNNKILKIGFDISQTTGNKAGCGFFAEGLIQHLAKVDKTNQYLLYPDFGDQFWGGNQSVCNISQNNFSYAIKHSSFANAKAFWRSHSNWDSVDIIHSNNFYSPIKSRKIKQIYTLYDLSFLRNPDYTTEKNRQICFQGLFNASMNADHMIAISNYTKNHFLDVFSYYPEEKIEVVYPASRFAINTPLYPRPERLNMVNTNQFLLNVGTLEPRKNQIQLLHAYAEVKKQIPTLFPLVFAGGTGWMMKEFEETIKKLNLSSHIILLGYVSDPELIWLYQNAICLIYPSLFEGFGLPLLEAMSLGCPVISSNVSSIPEVVGNAGILIDPTNNDRLVKAILQVLTSKNYRIQQENEILKQAKKFCWDHSAENMIKIYQKVNQRTA